MGGGLCSRWEVSWFVLESEDWDVHGTEYSAPVSIYLSGFGLDEMVECCLPSPYMAVLTSEDEATDFATALATS